MHTEAIRAKPLRFDLSNRVLVVLALALCVISVIFIPFLDRTEGRTAVVARSIGETGSYFDLKSNMRGEEIDYWAKPPMHYWLVHFSYKIFGENSFGARVPNFIAILISMGILWWGAQKIWNKEKGLAACTILLSSGLFFFVMALCLVDTTLTAALTTGMVLLTVSFQENQKEKRSVLTFLAALAFGFGFDIKGPVAIVLPGLSLFLWFIWKGQWKLLRHRAMVFGFIGFLLVTLPIYIPLEIYNPGFSKYFFLNENFLRFLVKNYGDRFGSGHIHPYGMSWIFLAASFLPWTLLFSPMLYKFIKSPQRDSNRALLLCWGLAPALFFTFARQHLATYLLPGFGGLALFIATAQEEEFSSTLKKILSVWVPRMGFVTCIGLVIFGVSWESQEPEWPQIIVAICLCLLFLQLLRHSRMQQNAVDALVRASFFICLTLATSEIAMSHYIGDVSSTQDILHEIREHYPNGSLCLRFPDGVPYSANMYEDKTTKLVMHECPPHESDRNLIVLRKKDLANFESKSGKTFTTLFQDGKWMVTQ